MITFVFSKVTLAGVLENKLGVGRRGPEFWESTGGSCGRVPGKR